jgi:hypothetical protein
VNEIIKVAYSALKRETLVKLDNSLNPNTVQAILENLPINVNINRWGEELYTDKTLIAVSEENSTKLVELFDVAFWPPGQAICFFYGPTPISKPDKILTYSPVNVVGKIIPYENEKSEILDKIRDKMMVLIRK